MDSERDHMAALWRCDEDGWWTWHGSKAALLWLSFQFAAEAGPSELVYLFLEGGHDSLEIGADHHHDFELQVLRKLLNIATGLRMSGSPREVHWSKLVRALEVANDPIPLLSRLEVLSYVAVDERIWTEMRAGKFSKLKVIRWGSRSFWDQQGEASVARESPTIESEIQSLAEVIQEGRFSVLCGLSVHLGKSDTCSEGTVNSLILAVKGIQNLRSLGISGSDMQKGQAAFANVVQSGHLDVLEELNLSSTVMPYEYYGETFAARNFKQLQHLNLSSNGIGTTGIKALAKMFADGNFKELRDLDVSQNNIGDYWMEALVKGLGDGNLKELQKLNLSTNRIGRWGMQALVEMFSNGSFKELHDLDVSGNDLGESGMEALAKAFVDGNIKTLCNLNVSGNQVGDSGMKALAKALADGNFKELHTLDVSGNAIRKSGMKALAKAFASGKFQKLQTLNLSWNEREEDCMEAIIKALADGNIKELRSLDISGTHLGASAMDILAKSFADGNFKKLQTLNFYGNAIDEHLMKAFAKAIADGIIQELRNLDVSSNYRAGSGIEVLVKALADGHCQKLQNLYLSGNNIGQSGIEAIAKLFADGNFKELCNLDVSDNGIGRGGMEALANAFALNSFHSLDSFSVKGNDIGVQGAEILAHAFRTGSLQSLSSLNVGFNRLGNDGAKILLNVLVERKFQCLEHLDMSCNDITIIEFPDTDLLSLRNLEISQNSGLRDQGLQALAHTLASGRLDALRFLTLDGIVSTEKGVDKGVDAVILAFANNPKLIVAIFGIHWYQFPEWDRRGKQLLERNREYLRILRSLGGEPLKSATFSKTYLCGYQKVGKTTLLKSLQRSAWRAMFTWERRSRKEARTRGIQTSRLLCEEMDIGTVEQGEYWDAVIQEQKKRFSKFLDIQVAPFYIDARRRKSVQGLKRDLVGWSRHMLQNRWIPTICAAIQSNLNLWSQEQKKNYKQFPVMRWAEFVTKMQKERQWPEHIIEAAIRYLNEAGILIFVNQKFPTGWDIPECKLVILDPNLLCNQVLGDVFLPDGIMTNSNSYFRRKVDKLGSISIDGFESFFHKRLGTQLGISDLVSIMMALGLCYKGQEQNLIIPALITEERTKIDCWDNQGPSTGYEKGQWVMGFSVEPREDDISLAPLALWTRFQVELAQSRDYNGLPQNDFVISKKFVAFTFEDMFVLIQVQTEEGSNEGSPTFVSIDFLVKPRLIASHDVSSRAIRQVSLADILVEMLLNLGNRICPGVKFMQRVVWPWPAGYSWCRLPTNERRRRNVEVAEVRKWVKEGSSMHDWKVGDEEIAPYQLLSSRDTEYLLKSVQNTSLGLELNVRAAEAEGIFPRGAVLGSKDGSKESVPDMSMTYCDRKITEEGDCKAGSSSTTGQTSKIGSMERRIYQHVDRNHASIKESLNSIYNVTVEIRDELSKQRAFQSIILQKIQDVGKIFSEDTERRWPRFMYLGEEKSGAWISLKKAISMNKKVHVHFCCEARHDNCQPHPVEDQAGINIAEMKDWARAAAPWLKVSLTVLFITAKVAANVVAPGLGLAIPDFQEWQQTSVLAEGIALGTGYTKQELDDLIRAGGGAEASGSRDHPRELYGKSKRAMTAFLERLSYAEFCMKLGLQRVVLSDRKGDLYGIAWICNECYQKHRQAGRLRDF